MINGGAFLYAARQSINCDRPNCKDESITRYSVVYYIEQCCRNTPQNCIRIRHVTQHNCIHRSQATCIHCWQVTLHNLYVTTCTSDHTTHLYIRSHNTTCTPGHWLDNLCARCHCSVYQVTSRNLYARCHNTTCTPGRTKQPVHQATLHSCMPGDTAQPVRQVTTQSVL